MLHLKRNGGLLFLDKKDSAEALIIQRRIEFLNHPVASKEQEMGTIIRDTRETLISIRFACSIEDGAAVASAMKEEVIGQRVKRG